VVLEMCRAVFLLAKKMRYRGPKSRGWISVVDCNADLRGFVSKIWKRYSFGFESILRRPIRSSIGALSAFEVLVVDRYSAVEHVASASPSAVLLWRLLKVLQDAALQVVDLFEAFLQHEG